MNDDSTPCRKCGSSITFKRMDNGKWKPIDQDTGYDHWPTCSGWEAPMSEEDRQRFEYLVYKY